MVEDGAATSASDTASAVLVATTADYTAAPIAGISSTAAIIAAHSP